jgi:hypothetical protein
MHLHSIARAITVLVAILGAGSVTALPATAAAHPSRHHSRHPVVRTGIPQHNGGDRDGDNNGTPSDGDGNV